MDKKEPFKDGETDMNPLNIVKIIWRWGRNIWLLSNNVKQVLEDHEEIIKHLEEIKSPRSKLEVEKLTIDIMKERFENEKILLEQKGAKQSEEDKKKLVQLEKKMKTLSIYNEKVDVALNQASTMITERDRKIEELEKELKKHAPPIFDWSIAIGEALATGEGASGILREQKKSFLDDFK
ncbi:MAG: hypothetical protein HQ575_03790 [Candidatus Omnitrophica bacterium]|nr:hypothetical protein [Candidatus Omnitrophota bacterium]